MIFEILFIAVLTLCLYLLHQRATKNNDYFKLQGLKYRKPNPITGTSTFVNLKENFAHVLVNYYNQFSGEKVFGLFDLYVPAFFIRSPEIVKQVTVKDFPHFQDRRTFPRTNDDELFSNSLFVMKGQAWRDMRSSLSPLFTGSKMRLMLELIVNYSNEVVKFLKEDYKTNGLKPYKIKDFFSRCTNDIIAICAFGVECNSFKNPTNEVFTIGQGLLSFQKPGQTIKFFLIILLPKIAKLFNVEFIDRDIGEKFENLIRHAMDIRRKEGIVRPDMLNLLMKLKDGQKLEDIETEVERQLINGSTKQTWTDTELIAQCFLFFLGGFDTTSNALQYCAYELAVNPEIQETLKKEVDETFENLNGQPLSYEALKKMKYMDMVVSEVLRKWPPFIAVDRQCVKDYKYEDDEGFSFSMNEGDVLSIPIYAFHMDPKYYPNPEKFDPERFNDENRKSMNMNAYLPFGMGPRNCIGFRFALMEVKTLLFYILQQFSFKACEETQIPVVMKKAVFGLIPDKEIKLFIEPRVKI